MLYRLSYASRRKFIIILVGSQIARRTSRFFLAPRLSPLAFPTRDHIPSGARSPFSLEGFAFCEVPRAAEGRDSLLKPGPRPTPQQSVGSPSRRQRAGFPLTMLRSIRGYSRKYFIGFTGVSPTITS
jgi:hypothetical protein